MENLPVRIFLVDRKAADQAYGDIMLDESGIPTSVSQLRLVYLAKWAIMASPAPFAASTGVLKSLKELSFKWNEEKSSLEVTIAVDGTDDVPLAETPELPITQLPSLRDILPESCPEVMENASAGADADDDVVTPWKVAAGGSKGVDYDKLVTKFGCSKLTPALVERFEKATGHRAHHFIRRGLFFAHRDMEAVCEAKEKGKPLYLYTGRGPSSEALHVGHLIPFIINAWLQKVLDVPIVIQLTDDEKFIFGQNKPLEEYHRCAYENARDIMACGFDPEKTFIFTNLDYIGQLYPTVLEIQKRATFSQVRGIFGFDDSCNIGKVAFPAVQASPALPCCFPGIFGSRPADPVRCLIPCAIDQDPYFRMTRDVASRMGFLKPSNLYCKFIPALQGAQTKMSGSAMSSAIAVTDDQQTIRNKVMKFAFSGGRDTAEEQRLHGANLELDVSYQYLTFFLEDDEELEQIASKYSSGQMLTGEVKERLAQVLGNVISEHQRLRSQVTSEVLKKVMNPDRPVLRARYKQLSQ